MFDHLMTINPTLFKATHTFTAPVHIMVPSLTVKYTIAAANC